MRAPKVRSTAVEESTKKQDAAERGESPAVRVVAKIREPSD